VPADIGDPASAALHRVRVSARTCSADRSAAAVFLPASAAARSITRPAPARWETPDGGGRSELRVHGVERLRVADASIMPTVVSGNTNAATIMIGERVADMAREKLRLAA